MLNWFKSKPKSTLADEQRHWIDQGFSWLIDCFGEQRIENRIIVPSDEFFPDRFTGTTNDAETMFSRICSFMDVDPSRITLQFYKSQKADDVGSAFRFSLDQGFALGLFDEAPGSITIWIEQTRLNETQSLVGTMSHELGHVHLLADRRCDESYADHEPLTDLLTIYFGMGIFTANSTLRETSWQYGGWSGWSASRKGYLSMDECGYALAVYADLRNESQPDWLRYLRPDLKPMVTEELKRIRMNHEVENGFWRLQNRVDAIAPNEAPFQIPVAPSLQVDTEPDPKQPLEDTSDDAQPDEVQSSIAPGDPDALFSHGVFSMGEMNYESAVEAFSAALQLVQDDAELWFERGRAYDALGQYLESIEDYSQALNIDPNYFEARSSRAFALLLEKQYSAALEDAEIALKKEKKDSLMHLICGVAKRRLNDFNGALKSLKLAIRYEPTAGVIYYARSLVHGSMGNSFLSSEDLAEAIRRDPTFSDEAYRGSSIAAQ